MGIATVDEYFSDQMVEQKIARVMAALSSLELSNGVALLADGSLESCVLLSACIRLGVKTALCPLREPHASIEQWRAQLGIEHLLAAVRTPACMPMGNVTFVEDLLGQDHAAFFPDRSSQFVSLIRTSGTTASPKTAIIPARAHKASAHAVCDYFSFTSDSVWALSLPLFHVSGLSLIFRMMHAHASLFIASSMEELLAGLQRGLITHLSLVPTQLSRMLAAGADFSCVTAIILGGDRTPTKLREQAQALSLPVYETYGLTETASMIWVYDVRNQTGRLLPHAALRVAPDGELCVAGHSLFSGYVGNSPHQGWFKTGDLGALYGSELCVVGRKHHRIISGGENIQAEEIERVLEQHPSIELSVVIGIADADLGMRPCAIIKWCAQPLSAADLDVYLRHHIAGYKIPKTIVSWPKDGPTSLKKPRQWFQNWLPSALALDNSVIVCA